MTENCGSLTAPPVVGDAGDPVNLRSHRASALRRPLFRSGYRRPRPAVGYRQGFPRLAPHAPLFLSGYCPFSPNDIARPSCIVLTSGASVRNINGSFEMYFGVSSSPPG